METKAKKQTAPTYCKVNELLRLAISEKQRFISKIEGAYTKEQAEQIKPMNEKIKNLEELLKTTTYKKPTRQELLAQMLD